MKNKDMPAIPCDDIDTMADEEYASAGGRFIECKGLTKREMFAMHAPIEIPEWFSRSFQPSLEHIEAPELTEHQQKMMEEYESDNYGLSQDNFKIGSEASSLMRSYCSKCEAERAKQAYFAWKAYHADALLEELEK